MCRARLSPSSQPPPDFGERALGGRVRPGSLGLGARSAQERATARRTSLARLRRRDGAPERMLRARRRLDRFGGDRRRRPLVRRRRSLSPPRRVRDVDVTRHRVALVHARAPRRAVRPVRARPGDQSVPRPRCRAARSRAAPGDARGRLAPRGRAREAAPGEDVAGLRRRPHDDRRCSISPTSTSPGMRASTRHCPRSTSRTARSRSPGRASCRRRGRARARCSRRSSRAGSRASTSTTRRTGSARTGSSRAGRRRCPRSDGHRILPQREGRLSRDALLRRRLASLDLPQGDHGRRARRMGRDHRLARLAARTRRHRRGSRATRRRARSATRRGDLLGSLSRHPAEPGLGHREGARRDRERAPRHQGKGARHPRLRALRRTDAGVDPDVLVSLRHDASARVRR